MWIVAKNNWGNILKTIVSIVLDLMKSSNSTKNTGTSTKTTGSRTNTSTSQRTSKPSSTRTTPKTTSKKTTKTVRSADSTPQTNADKTSSRTTAKERTNSATRANDSKPDKSSSSATTQKSSGPARSTQYPRDYAGKVSARYAPELDGDPDPGEIVWTWVPYEEDFTQGKDRPVLVIGHDGQWLLGLMLTSKDKDGSRYGHWLDIGSGPWDSQGRDSEIRLDRIIRIHPESMRREGAIMDEDTFNFVVDSM